MRPAAANGSSRCSGANGDATFERQHRAGYLTAKSVRPDEREHFPIKNVFEKFSESSAKPVQVTPRDPAPWGEKHHPRFGFAQFWKAGNVDYKKVPALKGLDLSAYPGKTRKEVGVTVG